MKRIAFLTFILICTQISFGQCGKTSVLTSSRTEYLDASYAVQRTVDEESIIEMNKSQVIITPGNQMKMIGTVISDSCLWKNAFKEGISIIKAHFTKEGEKRIDATITIEGKNGTITFLLEMKEMPDRKIRVIANKFEEKI